ncbi:Dynamin, GTPase domain protein [Akanthomyces lecanii RCEF 1005]|uniref:Dynamin, GTPase domain protein n=1 Tax=Akanthomyces lecanii RCEF 1005 TaxID=1081108 RepID=A0A162MZ22_CORDF|nr:Dynamin, GTPase domain protein [Akanthomyces lecanii RCEF 1005]
MYNLAYDVFTSILGSGWQNNPEICLTNDQAALEALEAAGRSLMSGNKEHPLAFTSVEALSERLRDMNSSGLHSETPTLCYLLKKIKVFIKASVLCHGVVLADLPGLGDVNAVRRNCTERYLLESQEILAVCSIGRAATDSSVQDIFYLAKQAELHNVNIVTTKCDDLLLEEFEIDVKGTPKTEFRQMVKDKVNAEVQLKISEEKVRSFLSETEELTAHESSRLVKANIECLESRKQLEKTEADLENFMVTTRNSATHMLGKTKKPYFDPNSNSEHIC